MNRTSSQNVVSRYLFASHQKMALRQKALMALMDKGTQFGVLSAYGPNPKSVNQQLNGELMADLQRLGYHKIIPLHGSWEGVKEKSYFIPKMKAAHLFTLGAKYNQISVIYKGADGVIGMYYIKERKAEIAMKADESPAADLSTGEDLYSKGRGFSFSFGFLWGQKLPWDGRHALGVDDIEGQLDFTA